MLSLRRWFVCVLVLGFLSAPAAAQDVVIAPGAGSPPIIRVIHADGTETSFYAYAPSFTGGVHVALGDVNGDGVPDIITGAGVGGGPHVAVFNGKDLSVLASFFAYASNFSGGVYVAAGDVDGDGRADIITGAGAGGGPHVQVFSGADLSILASFYAYSPSFNGGVRVAAGDIDGDGRADIITAAGPGGGPHVEAFSGADLSILASFYAYSPSFNGGVFVASGDFDGDGHADIVTGAGAGGGPHVEVFSGADQSILASFYAFAPSFNGGVSVGVVDFDGDGRPELVTGAGPGGSPDVKIFTADLSLWANFYGFDPSFTGGVFIGSMPGGSGGLHITSAPNATFTVGSLGTFEVKAVGGTGAITLTQTGALPAGVTFTDNGDRTATLTGTPGAGAGGTYPLTLTAADGGGQSATQSFALTVQQSPAITSANAAFFTLGAANSFSVTTTGFPRPALTVTSALPQGVMFTDNGDGTGTLNGIPAAGTGGAYPITITAANNVGSAAVQSFTLNVTLGPAITSGPAATFTAVTFGTFTVTTAGSPTPTITETGALPGGVSFTDNGNGTATLSGMVALGAGGVYPITITAANGVGSPATQSFTLTVNQLPGFTSAAAATFVVGNPNTFTVTTNAVPNATFTVGGIVPSGVTFVDNGNGTATIAGPPATSTSGSYPLTIVATNPVGFSIQSFDLTVVNPPQPIITSGASATFNVGALGSFSVTTAALPAANAIAEIGGLPAGVTFVNNGDGTATLSGRPNPGTQGLYPLTVSASNGGPSTLQPFTLIVGPVAGGSPTITSANTTTFPLGMLGAFTVTTTGTPTPAVFGIGALPPGIGVVDNGDGTATISGIPSVGSAGLYPLTITANNGATAAIQNFTLNIANNVTATPLFTSAPSTAFTVGVAGTFNVTTAATPSVGSITQVGPLPAGVNFVDNHDGTATLSALPAANTAGLYSITLTASGPGGATTQSFTLKVLSAASITSTASATFTVATPGTFTVTSAGVPTAVLNAAGAVPSGINFVDNGDGTATLSGPPAAGTGGVHTLIFEAINGVGTPAAQTFTLSVNDAGRFTSANTATFTPGSLGSFTITTESFPVATTITRGGVSLPTGVSFTDNHDGTATLTGTPAVGTGGTYAITFSFDNGVAGPVTQDFTLVVQQPPAITSASSTTFTVGTLGSFTVTSTGVPTATLTQSAALPAGINFVDNGNGTATLSGTPAASTGGPHTLTFTASNGVGSPATQSFTLTINDAGRFTSATSTTFTVGINGNILITTQAFPSTGTITRTGTLPTGVSFNDHADGTATLSGTPAAGTGGTYAVTFTFSNGVGAPATQSFTLTVNDPPHITTATLGSVTVGVAISPALSVDATGFPTPTITQTGGTLPSGTLFTSATHQVTGTPTQLGPFSPQFTASNGIVPDELKTLSLMVVCPTTTVNPSTLPDGLFNTPYSPITFSQTGSTGSSFAWSATGLPTGLSIAPTTGIVSGTPTNTVVNASVAITVTDNFGCTGTRDTTITIRPVAGNDSFNGIGNTQLAVGVVGTLPSTPTATNASGNTKANDAGPGTLSITFAGASANGGVIVEGNTDGSFFYTPPPNFSGANDSFSYTLTDGNGVTNTATVTINFFNRIWYVNSSGGNGDGRSHNPFNNLNNAQTPSVSGDIIYVHTGGATTAGNLAMDVSSTLQGAGTAVSMSVGTTTLLIPVGTAPTLTGTVTLANSTSVTGVNFTPSGIPALTATGVTSPISIDRVNVTGGTNALSLTNVSATVTVTSAVNFSNTSGAVLLINQGTGNVGVSAAITSNAGRSIDIQNRTAGTVTFSGTITDTGQGINLNANTGSTINFTGGLSLNTGANSAFTATGGGTVSATQNNTTIVNAISTSTATALNVANTTIGATGLTFRSISAGTAAAGPANGIVLNNTGAAAGLTVTGTGTNNSGGIIQNTTGDAIALTSTKAINLSEMRVATSGLSHIKATNVVGLTLTGVDTDLSTAAGILGNTVTNLVISGGTFNRGGVGAEPTCNVNGVDITNLLGTSSVTGATFTRSNTVQFRVNNLTATNAAPGAPDTLTVSGTTWDTQTGPCAGDHLSVSADTGGNFKLTTTASTAKNTFQTGGIGVQAAASGSGRMQASITGVQTSGNTAGVAIAATSTSNISFNVFDNNTTNGTGFSGTGSLALVLTCTTSGTCQGAFSNNTINHTAGTGTNAMQVVVEGDGDGIVTVANNTINGNFQRGFHARHGAGTGGGSLSLQMTGNNITGTDATGLQAVDIEASLSGDTTIVNTVCLNMSGNTASLAGGGTAYRFVDRVADVFQLQNFSGNGSLLADIQSWVTNTKGNAGTPISATIGQPFVTSASCASPILPTP